MTITGISRATLAELPRHIARDAARAELSAWAMKYVELCDDGTDGVRIEVDGAVAVVEDLVLGVAAEPEETLVVSPGARVGGDVDGFLSTLLRLAKGAGARRASIAVVLTDGQSALVVVESDASDARATPPAVLSAEKCADIALGAAVPPTTEPFQWFRGFEAGKRAASEAIRARAAKLREAHDAGDRSP